MKKYNPYFSNQADVPEESPCYRCKGLNNCFWESKKRLKYNCWDCQSVCSDCKGCELDGSWCVCPPKLKVLISDDYLPGTDGDLT